MTEPQKTEAEIKAETDAAAAKEAADKAAGDAAPASGTDRPALERALAKQAEDHRLERDKLQKQLASHESEKLKAREAKMLEDGKLQDLLDAREKTIKDQEAVIAMDARALLVGTAREKLRSLGMNHPRIIKGTLADLPTDATVETLDAWAAEMKGKSPEDFTAPATPIKPGDPGDPSIDAGGADLESRLKSEDNKVRAEAFNEQLKNDLGDLS